MNREVWTLRGGDRGAIMVLGLGMCAVLVGLLWYVIGIADIIWFRERAQEGADVAAFSSAVVHARGMNLIVLVNVMMAAILAIRVALKYLQIVLAVATVVVGILTIFDGGATAPQLARLINADKKVGDLITKTRKPINKSIQSLHKFGKNVVPKGTVAMAFTLGQDMLRRLEETPEGGPNTRDGVAIGRQDKIFDYTPSIVVPRKAIPAKGETFNPATALPLPVQDDTPEQLCGMAGEVVPEIIEDVVQDTLKIDISAVMTIFEEGAKKIAQSANGYFCENGAKGDAPPDDLVSTDDYDADIEKQCTKEKDEKGTDGGASTFDMDKCKKDKKDEINKKVEDKKNDLKSNGADNVRMTSIGLASGFVNGGDDAQLLSIVKLDTKATLLGEGPRGVRVATFGGTPEKAPAETDAFAFAQAEFYYDDGGAWKEIKNEAMWNFRWRARLRRVDVSGSFAKLGFMALIAPELAKTASALKLPKGVMDLDGFQHLQDLSEAQTRQPMVH